MVSMVDGVVTGDVKIALVVVEGEVVQVEVTVEKVGKTLQVVIVVAVVEAEVEVDATSVMAASMDV